MKYLIAALFIFWTVPAFSGPPTAPVSSFGKAKRIAEKIYSDHRLTFYCRCDYTADKKVDPNSCGYRPKRPITSSGKINIRPKRIEWEHVVPAYYFAKKLRCGSRKECKKNSPEFRHMEADLYNLVPAIGELNADRSSEPYGIIPGELREYGHCDFESTKQITEPAPFIRGDVARIWMYMNDTYDLDLSSSMIEQFVRWEKADPVSEWERVRAGRIHVVQGNSIVFKRAFHRVGNVEVIKLP